MSSSYDEDGNSLTMRLDFSKSKYRLYGREAQQGKLSDLWKNVREGASRTEVCFVHGLSGSGKTVLCKCLEKEITSAEASRGYFIGGKYDQFQSLSQPYSAIFQAFSNLADALIKDKTLSEDERGEIRGCLAFEGALIAKAIPVFSKLLGDKKGREHEEPSAGGEEEDGDDDDEDGGGGGKNKAAAKNEDDDGDEDAPAAAGEAITTDNLSAAVERLAVAFRFFLKGFCSASRPMVLFLDDLQWADPPSTALLASILIDNEDLHHFMMVGAYRDGEEDAAKVQPLLDRIHPLPVTHISASNLDIESTNALISGILNEDMEETRELAEIVLQKTLGNPYFILQFMEMLQRRGLLTFNFGDLKWHWGMEEITARTDVSENVAEVVSMRIKNLPLAVRRVLKCAACLGFFVDTQLLETLHTARLNEQGGRGGVPEQERKEEETAEEAREGHGTAAGTGENTADSSAAAIMMEEDLDFRTNSGSTTFEEALEFAKTEGLVEKSPGSAFCKFSHDRVRQCVYEMIPEGNARAVLHRRIGEHLRQTYGGDADDQYIFLIADQLNRGCPPDSLETEEERLGLIRLNQQASLAAKSKAANELVARFLDKAISLVVEMDWDTSYDMILDIYNLSAEIEFACGRLEAANERIKKVFCKVKLPDDTIRAALVKINIFGVQRLFRQAILEVRRILSLLGAPLPRTSRLSVMKELFLTKRLVKGKPNEYFVMLPPMTEERHVMVLKILEVATVYGWNCDTTFAWLSYLRMMRFTLLHGRCEATCSAYAGYGMVVAMFGNKSEGFRFSQLALKVESKASYASTSLLVYANLSHLQLPVALGLEPLLSSYRMGVETGDLFFGCVCLCTYTDIYMISGLPLVPFTKDMKGFGWQLRLCRQDLSLAYTLPWTQCALNLSGQSGDPALVTWEAIENTQETFNENVTFDKNSPPELYLQYAQVFNGYVLGRLDLANGAFKRILARKERRLPSTQCMTYLFTFLDGLLNVSLYRQKAQRKHKRFLNQSIKWLNQQSSNCTGMVKLLEAERVSLLSSTTKDKGKVLYDKAIVQLNRNGFSHFAAIANERAGEFMLSKDDAFWAEHYISRAATLYEHWGASVKAEQLAAKYSFVQLGRDDNSGSVNVSVYGRSRFNPARDAVSDRPGTDPEAQSLWSTTGSDQFVPSPPSADIVRPHSEKILLGASCPEEVLLGS